MFHRPAQGLEELHEGPGALGELEAVEPLVPHPGRAAAHHVAHVELGHLVVGQVDGGVALLAQPGGHRLAVAARRRLQPHEDVGLVAPGEAVVELGDDARPDRRAEGAEGPRPLGDGDPEEGLASLAHLGPLGHEAQAVEVHVGPGEDGDEPLALPALLRDPGLEPGHRQAPPRAPSRCGSRRRRP